MGISHRLGAEFFGTFWLTFGGCGAAVLDAAFPQLGIGFLGVAFAFGLTVMTMAFTVGHISGGHFNPAVTIGLWAGGRFKAADIIPYIIAQVVGAIVATAVLYLIASGKPNWPTRVAQISNCFSNQFEVPLLFYILIALALPIRHADLVIVLLSWVFVVTRFAYAGIFVTSNNVQQSSMAWFASVLVLFAMWLYFALRILLLI